LFAHLLQRADVTLYERDRRRRRRVWLSLLLFTLLAYPALLLGSSYFGSSLGMLRDVNASRALARALSYAADPRLPVEPGNDGQLATTALDSTLVALQLSDALAPGSPAGAGGPGTGAAGTPTQGGAPPAAGGGGGAGGGTPSPDPIAPPSPGPTAPPASPPPSPSPTPSPVPCSALPPVHNAIFDGSVLDANGNKVALATVTLFRGGCLVGQRLTGINGKFAIPGLVPNTSYGYTFFALGHPQESGSFVTGATGAYSRDLQFQ
jgi:hypothetical protein